MPIQARLSEVHCTYDPDTRGGNATKGRKIHGTIHWVSVNHALRAEVRLYDRLFLVAIPDEAESGMTFRDYLNPKSIQILSEGRIEPSVADGLVAPVTNSSDRDISSPIRWVPSREGLSLTASVELRDSWAKARLSDAQQTHADVDGHTTPDGPASTEKREGDGRRSRTEIRDEIRADHPDLAARLHRYIDELNLAFEDADVLTGNRALGDFFEAALANHDNPQTVAKWVTNEVLRELKENSIDTLPFGGGQLGALVALVDSETISSTIGKEVFAEMVSTGDDARAIVERRGLEQIADPARLEPVIDEVIASNAEKAGLYRSGKSGLLGFFVGQVMRETKGRANPQLVQELLEQRLA